MLRRHDSAFRIIILISAILIIGKLTIDRDINSASTNKPKLNLIPDEIRSDNFASSVPFHKQFIVNAPIGVVINFDREFDRFASSVTYNGNEVANTPITSQKSTFIRQSIKPSVGNGIYTVQYTVCFKQNCSDGQFVYQIDGHLLTQFANQTVAPNSSVVIEITPNSIKPPSSLVNRGSTLNFKNVGETGTNIRSEPKVQNNYFPALNSPEIKVNEAFLLTLDTPGLYFFYLESNPQIKGQIYVQNN